jgi:hypothetical protein
MEEPFYDEEELKERMEEAREVLEDPECWFFENMCLMKNDKTIFGHVTRSNPLKVYIADSEQCIEYPSVDALIEDGWIID